MVFKERGSNMKIYRKFYTENEIEGRDYEVKNDTIKKFRAEIIPQWGDAFCFRVIFERNAPMVLYYNSSCLDYIIDDLKKLFGIKKGCILHYIDIPCRIVYTKDARIVGLGHDQKNIFTLLSSCI